jgi:hypothetical protein
VGYIRHHAIIVTSWSKTHGETALVEARRAGCQTTGLSESKVNGYWTFLVCPDGSKEGWDDSNLGDNQREEFIAWLDSTRTEDGGSHYSWAEVQYGDDEGETTITAHSDEPPSAVVPAQPVAMRAVEWWVCPKCGEVYREVHAKNHAWKAHGIGVNPAGGEGATGEGVESLLDVAISRLEVALAQRDQHGPQMHRKDVRRVLDALAEADAARARAEGHLRVSLEELRVTSDMLIGATNEWRQAEARATAAEGANRERVAQLIAHRACCGSEHDPDNGKFHGCCVVCGVPWPCKVALPEDAVTRRLTAAEERAARLLAAVDEHRERAKVTYPCLDSDKTLYAIANEVRGGGGRGDAKHCICRYVVGDCVEDISRPGSHHYDKTCPLWRPRTTT